MTDCGETPPQVEPGFGTNCLGHRKVPCRSGTTRHGSGCANQKVGAHRSGYGAPAFGPWPATHPALRPELQGEPGTPVPRCVLRCVPRCALLISWYPASPVEVAFGTGGCSSWGLRAKSPVGRISKLGEALFPGSNPRFNCPNHPLVVKFHGPTPPL